MELPTFTDGNVALLANLAMLTGEYRPVEHGVNPLRGQNNVQAPVTWAAFPILNGLQVVTDEEVAKKFGRLEGIPFKKDRPYGHRDVSIH